MYLAHTCGLSEKMKADEPGHCDSRSSTVGSSQGIGLRYLVVCLVHSHLPLKKPEIQKCSEAQARAAPKPFSLPSQGHRRAAYRTKLQENPCSPLATQHRKTAKGSWDPGLALQGCGNPPNTLLGVSEAGRELRLLSTPGGASPHCPH